MGFEDFVDDASALGTVGIHEATTAYAARPAADAAYVGNLVVEDTDLPLLRGVTAPLHVVLGGGAGQIAVRFAGLGGAYGDPVTGHGFLNVLVATALLFDALPGAREALGADREELARLWPTIDPDRGRRWFTGFASLDPEQAIADLRALESSS